MCTLSCSAKVGPSQASPPHQGQPGPQPGLRSCLRSAPARRPCRAHSNQPPDAREGVGRGWGGRLRGLGSLFGTSLEDHGPNVVLYRAGPQTARCA